MDTRAQLPTQTIFSGVMPSIKMQPCAMQRGMLCWCIALAHELNSTVSPFAHRPCQQRSGNIQVGEGARRGCIDQGTKLYAPVQGWVGHSV